MRVDPCFMTPDRDQLILAETKLDISLDEAEALVAEINHFFKNYNEESFWVLHAVTAERWYIISDQPINIQTTAPEKVLMKSVKSFLLKGHDSQHWINLFNEFQMILHQSPVNKQRLEQGKSAINSVWFWGAGESLKFSKNEQQNSTHCVYSDNIVAKGLCVENHYEYKYLPEKFQIDNSFQYATYIIDDFSQAIQKKDIFSWVGLLQQYEKNYLVPILEELKSGKIVEVQFISPTGKKILLTKKLLNRWWGRIKHYYTLL